MAGEIFNRLYNTDIYAANRLLTDFEQDTIDELEKSGNYPNLFTESLQTDLYRSRLERLGVEQSLIHKLTELHRTGISWSKIYRISEICQDKEIRKYRLESLLIQIAKRDDLEAIRVLDNFVDLLHCLGGPTISNFVLNIFIKNKSKKIIKYIIDNSMITSFDSYSRLIYGIARWNDLDFLRQNIPIISRQMVEKFGNRDAIDRNITASLFGDSNSPAAISYLAEIGFQFNGIEMAFIAKNPETAHLVLMLQQRGAPQIDWEAYRLETEDESE